MVISSLSELLLGNRKLFYPLLLFIHSAWLSGTIHLSLVVRSRVPSKVVDGTVFYGPFYECQGVFVCHLIWSSAKSGARHDGMERKSKGSEKLFCPCHILERKSRGSKGHTKVNTHQIPDWHLCDSVSECISVFSSSSPHLLSLFGSGSWGEQHHCGEKFLIDLGLRSRHSSLQPLLVASPGDSERRFRASQEIWSLWRVEGPPRGLIPVEHARKHLSSELPGTPSIGASWHWGAAAPLSPYL